MDLCLTLAKATLAKSEATAAKTAAANAKSNADKACCKHLKIASVIVHPWGQPSYQLYPWY